METSPAPNRQRNRRSDRYEQEADSPPMLSQPDAPAAPTPVPLPRALQKTLPQVPPAPVPQSSASRVPAPRVLQSSGDMPVRPIRRDPAAYEAAPVRSYAPQNQPVQRSSVPVPSALQRRQEPVRPPAGYDSAPAVIQCRPSRQRMMDEPAATPVPQESETDASARRMPGWMIGSLAGMFLLVMAMITSISLMQAYLKTQADAREAAYQATLSNYHVLAGNDGTMSVTYQDAIEYYSAEYNLQPAFVTAIIRNESSFRRDAESDVGARGLMQLMEDTSGWIAGKLNVDDFHFDMMYDAETNIRFGCWYLGYLSRLFRGDPVLVSAAYHAGQTTVSRWLSDRSISPDGMTIPLDLLVDGPTKTYVGRVTKAYGIYHALLYPNQKLHSQVAVAADGAGAVRKPVIER